MSKKQKNAITNYFGATVKKQRLDNDCDEFHASTSYEAELRDEVTDNILSQADYQPSLSPGNYSENRPKDICKFIKTGKLNEEEKFSILSSWAPDKKFKFPFRQFGSQKRKFSVSWLEKYKWLAYSAKEDSAYCKVCMVFAPEVVGMSSSQATGHLVKVGFHSWNKALEKFETHQKLKYHQDSILKAENFLDIKLSKKDSIDKVIDKARAQQALENRNILKPIIETVTLCGRQNLALRAHTDYGVFDVDNPPLENEGNFRALLRARVTSGDTNLKKHFDSCRRNATYISWNIQNQIIDACQEIITRKIVDEVNSAQAFSILADETADISKQEQFTLCLRYVKQDPEKRYFITENFLQFVPLKQLTGEYMAETLLKSLDDCGIDTIYLRGQGFDGAAAMSGVFKGAQAFISKKHPKALYVHCAAHCLNLAISNSTEVSAIRNCFGTIQKIWDFFNTPKRQAVLQEKISEMIPESNKLKLKKICPTRWVERHESVMVMVELLHAVIAALEKIREWEDKDASSGALLLSLALEQPDFIVALLSAEKLMSYTLKLSRTLQSDDYDLAGAISYAESIISSLSKIRQNAIQEFASIFEQCKKTASIFGLEISVLRIVKGRQYHRANVPAETPEEYYRRAVFLPWLDSLLNNLSDRFTKHKDVLANFKCLLPNRDSHVSKEKKEQFLKLVDMYKDDLECESTNVLSAEFQLWHEKFHSVESVRLVSESKNNKRTVSNTAIIALNECDKRFFPNVHILLKLLCTLPISTSTPERTFSTLKRIKTYLRNTMSETRLNGLASLNIHREIHVDPEEVIDVLVKKGPRKLNFVL